MWILKRCDTILLNFWGLIHPVKWEKSEKMHKFRKSLNISLMKTSTVTFHCLKSCSQSTVSQKNYQGSHFLPFHLFNFLTFTFFKVFSSSFQSMFRGLISDIGGRSCYQVSKHGNYFLTNQAKPFLTFFLVVKFQTFGPCWIFTVLSY